MYDKHPIGNYIGIILLSLFIYFLTCQWEYKKSQTRFFNNLKF